MKLNRMIIAATILASLSSCVKEKFGENMVDSRSDVTYLNEINVSLNAEDSKVTPTGTDVIKFEWNDGDLIFLYPADGSSNSYTYRYNSKTEKFSSLDPAPSIPAGYYAVFGKNGAVSNAGSSGNCKALFTIQGDTYKQQELPMISEVSKNNYFSLKQICGMFQLPLTCNSSVNLYKLVVKANSNFAGTFYSSPSANPTVSAFASGEKSLTLYPTNVELNSTPKLFNIPFVPGTYSGISVELYVSDGAKMYKTVISSANTLTITRSEFVKAGTLTATKDMVYLPKPAAPAGGNNVVAHRCGYKELGGAANSISNFKICQGLGLAGGECDAYLTTDNQIVICHADAEGKVFGLFPHQNDLATLRAAGKLGNEETLPTLDDFLKIVVDERFATKMIIDIKRIDYPSSAETSSYNCGDKAIDKVIAAGAQNFVAFLITSTLTNAHFSALQTKAVSAGIDLGMNYGTPNSDAYWCNPDAVAQMASQCGGEGGYTPESYSNKGKQVSTYSVDKEYFNESSACSETAHNYYKANWTKFKYITTNFPQWLLNLEISSEPTDFSGGSGTAEDPYILANAGDFISFAYKTNADALYEQYVNKCYILTDDIDLSDYTGRPVCNAIARAFTGVFDGQNHRIYNIRMIRDKDNACFWSWNKGGVIKNLVLGTKDGHNWDGVSECRSIAANENLSTPDDWAYHGTFGRFGESSGETTTYLQNVSSYIKVNVTEQNTCKNRMGGLLAMTHGGVEVSNCRYYGTVINNSKSALEKNEQLIGGIVGSSDGSGNKIINCESRGSISAASNAASGKAFAMAGVLGNVASAGGMTTFENNVNYAEVSYTGTPLLTAGGKQCYVGGVVGLPNSTQEALLIKNCKNYGNVSSTNAQTGGILAGSGTSKGCSISIDACENYGKISNTGTTKIQECYYGGIVGSSSLAAGMLVSISNCTNRGAVYCTGSDVVMAGGIAGRIDGTSVSNCHNYGTMTYNKNSNTSNALSLAGICGGVYSNGTVTNCHNHAAIFSNRKQVNRTGGVVGTLSKGSVSQCTNEGTVTVQKTASTTNWQSVAGVVGFADQTANANDISGCENKVGGTVVLEDISTNDNAAQFGIAAGGIVGRYYSCGSITNNVNRAAVSATNGESGTTNTYAGGIIGADNGGVTVAISGNKNYGAVSVTGTSVAPATNLKGIVAAGGVCGCNVISTCATNNESHASVTRSANETAFGGTGAAIGHNEKTFSNTKVSGSVNGVTLTASNYASYLCSSNSGTVTGSYGE